MTPDHEQSQLSSNRCTSNQWPRFGAVLLIAAAGSVALSGSYGCTVIVDSDADQCSTDADCTARGAGFEGTTCADNVCVQATAGCVSNEQCTGLGQYYVCNRARGACASILSTECTTVEGDYTNDAAIILGSILPTQGEDAATGLPIENSIRLAIGDFRTASNGLPPVGVGEPQRPLVLVGCNDGSNSDTAVVAAKHLVNDIGVPAIIGAAFSGITIRVATEVTIPGGTLLISPSATSVAITGLVDGGLVWRTSPSDVFQASALEKYIPLVEQSVRTELGLTPSDPVRVAILHKGDAYGTGLGGALEKVLEINGASVLDSSNQSNYLRFDYGNPDDPTTNPTKYPQAVAQALTLAPHVILVFGTNEGVTEVLEPIEQQWSTAGYKPRYLLSDGGLINDLWDYVGTNDELRKRVGGTVPGTDNILFKSFKSQYSTKFTDGTSPDVFGAAGGFDALYLLAYAAVSLGATPITGASLSQGLAKTTTGTAIDVGASNINDALTPLLGGSSINFTGASGPLDFDLATGEAPSDIQIWCLPKDNSGKATAGIPSGQFYNAISGNLEGSVGTKCD